MVAFFIISPRVLSFALLLLAFYHIASLTKLFYQLFIVVLELVDLCINETNELLDDFEWSNFNLFSLSHVFVLQATSPIPSIDTGGAIYFIPYVKCNGCRFEVKNFHDSPLKGYTIVQFIS